MASRSYVTGLKETQIALHLVNESLERVLPSTLEMIGKLGVTEAKVNIPIYTKALYDSVHYKLSKKLGQISVSVIAGDDSIIEGLGNYPFPAGASYPPTPTTEYAETIDLYGGPKSRNRSKGYMSVHAFKYLDMNAPKLINELIHEIVSRF